MNLRTYLGRSRYVYDLRKRAGGMKRGLLRTLWLMGGVAKLLVVHKFNLFDYGELDDTNILIFSRYDREFEFYLPHWREDVIQSEIYCTADFFSVSDLEYLRANVIKSGDIVLDIGANIGNHTVYFATLCGANEVYSFEPIKETYETLVKNIELNRLTDKVRTYNIALGKSSGLAEAVSYDTHFIGSTKVREATSGSLRLERLDNFSFKKIDVIKIDVETFEYDVLLGAEQTLKTHSPKLFIEIWEDNFSRVNELLSGYGYSVEEKLSGIDYLYVKIAERGTNEG